MLSSLDVAHSPASAVVSHPRLRGMSGSESSDTRTTTAITLPTLHLTNKMVASSVALAAEAARLPGGAELNILPANGAVRATTSGRHHPITLSGGLCCVQNHTHMSEVTVFLSYYCCIKGCYILPLNVLHYSLNLYNQSYHEGEK
jgi:hypothetical protein